MALVKSLLLCVIITSAPFAAAVESFVYLGYGTLYNASVSDDGKLSGHLWRTNYLQHWKRFKAEIEVQNRMTGKEQSPFLQASAGCRLLDKNWFPELWAEGAVVYLSPLPQTSQGRTLETFEGGIGLTAAVRTAWLPEGYGNFSVVYYPVSGFFYKNMQVGWDVFEHLGVSFGGLGIRTHEGRFYSSFTFSVRGRF